MLKLYKAIFLMAILLISFNCRAQTLQSLQAKEGRRPRPVVPGSLRAGCFAAGKI